MRSIVIIVTLLVISLVVAWKLQPQAHQTTLESVVPAQATPSASPSPAILPLPVDITAKAAIVIDASTGAILAAKNPDMRLMPASTTKMMTAYVALQNYQPDEIVTIARSQDAIGKSTHFTVGDQYTVADMLKAMLINSGNDAALALADHHPNGYHHFVAHMNLQAQSWGLKNTHFTNVSGVEEDDHYSSAKDLSVIAMHIMQLPQIRSIVNQFQASITTIDGKHTLRFESTNKLLGQVDGLIGVKTGWTDNAGDCLVAYVHRHRDIITVVLGGTDRFGDTKTLIEWAYQQ